ncbi:DUF1508 domain-containing protein [Aminobacter aminovorans]|uniref:DUF1508 domain-containing protein n=1 Tax=Aminobacter aminovorans TaxID=83263 RepID=UPI0028632943|nr:DUF1508 domain-containing protein [Aminobacter aminovorans]MDR7221267.1 uncharacterized protein YegP (UPF0339 family) [Aminobacter aminovorans]
MATRPYPSYYMYKDTQKLWRWRYDASNAKTIAVSSESYHNRADCQRGIDIMKASQNSEVWMPSELVNSA